MVNLRMYIPLFFALGSQLYADDIRLKRSLTSITLEIDSGSHGVWEIRDRRGTLCDSGIYSPGASTKIAENLPVSESLVVRLKSSAGNLVEKVSNATTSVSDLSKPVGSSTIYQLPVRTYFAKGLGRENRGRLQDLTPRVLRDIKDFGADYLWLTGIISHADPQNTDVDVVKGSAGSYYAIVDSWDVSPQVGDVNVLSRVMADAHSIGVRVILDLVVNHTARHHKTSIKCKHDLDFGSGDEASTLFNPSNHYFYVQPSARFVPPIQSGVSGADGQFDTDLLTAGLQFETPAKVTGNNIISASPDINDWFETAKLNYGYNFTDGTRHYEPVPRTWLSVADVAEYWLRAGVDGFRVDFAHSVPIEFWQYFARRIRSVNPNAFLLAEAYESDFGMKVPGFSYEALLDAGFDSVYNSELYWDARRSLASSRSISGSFDRSPAMRSGVNRKAYRFTHYMENHDEIRLAAPEFLPRVPDAQERVKIGLNLTAYLALLPGNLMIHGGQELGEDASVYGAFAGDNGRTSIFDFVYQTKTLDWLNGLATEEQKQIRESYRRILQLKKQEPFYLSHSDDQPTYKSLEFCNRSSPHLSAYVRYSSREAYLVVSNSDPYMEHELTVHFADPGHKGSNSLLNDIGIENSATRYLFVESWSKPGWIPTDPNIEGIGIPGWVLHNGSGIPSGVFLGSVPAGQTYLFKILRYQSSNHP